MNAHIIIRHLPPASFIGNKRECPIWTVDSVPRQRYPRDCINGPVRVSEVDLGEGTRGMLNQKCMGITEHGI